MGNELENMQNPFDNLSASDIHYLLENDKDKLTEEQVSYMKAKLQELEQTKINDAYSLGVNNGKRLNLTSNRNRRAGFIDVTILMLATWATCLCGLAYIYSHILG